MILAALLAAQAADDVRESNISATTVGLQLWQSSALRDLDAESSDLDVLLGQRLRWALVQKPGFALRLKALGRFTLSPGDDQFFKRNRVRQLSVSMVTPSWSLDIGRSPVQNGGPRLVDGLQLRVTPSRAVQVGLWGGLLPDLFTTNPRFSTPRFGGGPMIGLNLSRVQASVVGEVAVGGGGLDRVGVLVQARASAAQTIEISGRADLELIGAYGFRISDAQAFTRWTPTRALRFDLSYNVFSSYSYQNTQALDPALTRFSQRYLQNDPRLPALLADCVEPNAAHLVGGSFRANPKTDGVAPLVGLDGRFRFGPDVDLPAPGDEPACVYDDINQFVRVHPMLGITGLPVGGRLDVTVDGNFYAIEGRSQMDGGLALYWEPTDSGILAIDTSYRVLLNGYDGIKNPYGYQAFGEPGTGAIGHYGDFFVDLVVPPTDTSLGLGLNVVSEPGDLAEDLGIGFFARLTQYLRKKVDKTAPVEPKQDQPPPAEE